MCDERHVLMECSAPVDLRVLRDAFALLIAEASGIMAKLTRSYIPYMDILNM